MKITEIVAESVVQIWSRTKAGKMVRKYRCTAGPRKGRIVSSPGVCTQPKRLSSVMSIKKAKALVIGAYVPYGQILKFMYGPDARTTDYEYSRVEDQKDLWEEATRMGRLIGERVQNN